MVTPRILIGVLVCIGCSGISAGDAQDLKKYLGKIAVENPGHDGVSGEHNRDRMAKHISRMAYYGETVYVEAEEPTIQGLTHAANVNGKLGKARYVFRLNTGGPDGKTHGLPDPSKAAGKALEQVEEALLLFPEPEDGVFPLDQIVAGISRADLIGKKLGCRQLLLQCLSLEQICEIKSGQYSDWLIAQSAEETDPIKKNRWKHEPSRIEIYSEDCFCFMPPAMIRPEPKEKPKYYDNFGDEISEEQWQILHEEGFFDPPED